MRKKQIIDGTGTPLTPSRQGRKCLGNGEHPEYECCCDECNYYLYCFPQFDWRLKRNKFKKWIEKTFGVPYRKTRALWFRFRSFCQQKLKL